MSLDDATSCARAGAFDAFGPRLNTARASAAASAPSRGGGGIDRRPGRRRRAARNGVKCACACARVSARRPVVVAAPVVATAPVAASHSRRIARGRHATQRIDVAHRSRDEQREEFEEQTEWVRLAKHPAFFAAETQVRGERRDAGARAMSRVTRARRDGRIEARERAYATRMCDSTGSAREETRAFDD